MENRPFCYTEWTLSRVVFTEAEKHHGYRHYECQGVCDRAGIEDARDAHVHWQNNQKRNQEQALPRQRDEQSLNVIARCGEVIHRYGLYILEENQKHVDLQVFFGEFEVEGIAGAEYRDDLARKELERGKEYNAYRKRGAERAPVGSLYAVILFGTEVESPYRLTSLGDSDRKGDHYHRGLLGDSRYSKRDIGAVDRKCAVVGQHVVENYVGGHHEHVVAEVRDAGGHAREHVPCADAELAEAESEGAEARIVCQCQHAADKLRDGCGRSCSADPQAKREHKEPIKKYVEDRAGNGT